MKKVLKLAIPYPFNFFNLKRKLAQIGHLILNLKVFLFFFKKFPDNEYVQHLKTHPETICKCLGTYLSLQFSVKEKIKTLQFHHLFMSINFLNQFLNSLESTGNIIWEKAYDSDKHHIAISKTKISQIIEGELSLTYFFNESPIYSLVFTLASSFFIDGPAGDCFFIGASQGAYNCREIKKIVIRQNFRINPEAILIIALQAWAYKNNISTIIGVDVENQVSENVILNPSMFLLNYNELWERNGAKKTGNYYVLPNMPSVKDRSERNNYRSRDKKQQEIKQEIFYQVLKNIQSFLIPGSINHA